jgi:hypothetical protein
MKANPDAFRRAAAQVSSCTIDEQSLERQEERHRRLAASVVQMRHQGKVLLVDFAPDFDRQALDELIAVERECCPFFAFRFDEHSRHLEVGVQDPEAAQALGTIVQALSAKPPRRYAYTPSASQC